MFPKVAMYSKNIVKYHCNIKCNLFLWWQDFSAITGIEAKFSAAITSVYPVSYDPSKIILKCSLGAQLLGAKHRSSLGPYCISYWCCSSVLECMAAHRNSWRKVMKFGKNIEESLNINHSKLGVPISNSLAPPMGQICTNISAHNFWTVRSRSKMCSSNSLAHA